MKNRRYDKVSTYFFINKKSFIIASITGVIYNALMVFVPILLGYIINLANSNERENIIKYTILFLLFVIFIQINRYLKRYYVRDFSNKMVLQMRTICFKNLLKNDILSFNESSRGEIMTKNLSDIKDSAEGVRKILTEIYDSVILMSGYFISMMIMDYKITLIVSIFLIASVLIANLMKKLIYRATLEYKKSFSKSKDITLYSLNNELYYRGYGVGYKYDQKFNDIQNDLEKKSIKSIIFKSSFEPIYQAIALIGLFFVIYYAGLYVINEYWLIGAFSAYLSTYTLASTKISKIGKVFNAATNFKVSWKRCLPYLEEKNEFKNLEIDSNNSLIVSNLSFGFDNNFRINNISFNALKGEFVGICGMIHSGKSTLAAALSGLYDYDGGIRLCGLELKENKNKIINNFISYARENVEIFNDTIKYNISFENKMVDFELKMAELYDDVNEFTNKENEILSHSNKNLSGGQEKRLQIARCLYNSPKLIILDNPFNAIDIKMSEKILKNLKENYKNSIFIIVNNQKEILSQMDKIIFLKNNSYCVNKYDELINDNDFNKIIGGEIK